MRGGGRRCKLSLHDLKEKRRNRNFKRTHYYTLWNRLWTCHKTDYKMNEHQ
jgi:hypothetical protein